MEEHDPAAWASAYFVHPHGAVLVRPDGHAAARWPTALRRPEASLREALRALTR